MDLSLNFLLLVMFAAPALFLEVTDGSRPEGSPPRFKRPIISERVALVHDTMKFACKVRGSPTPYVLFYYEDQLVRDWRLDVFKNTLEIHDLKIGDSGKYACRAFNEHGQIWGNITLKVIVKPDDSKDTTSERFAEMVERLAISPIIGEVENQTAVAGGNVTFTCQIIMSDSQPLLQWLRHFKVNGSYVNEEGEPYVEILKGNFKPLDDPQYLHLFNVTADDEGWYTCLVVNTVGINHRSAWLTVIQEQEQSSENGRDPTTLHVTMQTTAPPSACAPRRCVPPCDIGIVQDLHGCHRCLCPTYV